MNAIIYALPLFFSLIGLEILIARWMGKDVYRLHDAITSMNIGAISEVIRSLIKIVSIVIYAIVVERVGAFSFDLTSPWVWILAFFMYDFGYYWAHRAGHEVNLLWCAHVVHHSSEEYNLSTALRQSWTNQVTYWMFYLPMAIVGIPVSVFITIAVLEALYQFWPHTRLVPKLGWMEWIFVTPSNHRVHHGRNEYCVDKNYGGTLIIWDRMFGSYAEERDDEPVVYGTLTPINSWNPVWANFKNYIGVLGGLFTVRGWRNKLMVVFAPPGWTPEGMQPIDPVDPSNVRKFETPTAKWQRIYAVLAWLIETALIVHWMMVQVTLTVPMRTAYGLIIVANAVCLSRIFLFQAAAVQIEAVRAVLVFGCLTLGIWFTPVAAPVQWASLLTCLVSLALLALVFEESSKIRPTEMVRA